MTSSEKLESSMIENDDRIAYKGLLDGVMDMIRLFPLLFSSVIASYTHAVILSSNTCVNFIFSVERSIVFTTR